MLKVVDIYDRIWYNNENDIKFIIAHEVQWPQAIKNYSSF